MVRLGTAVLHHELVDYGCSTHLSQTYLIAGIFKPPAACLKVEMLFKKLVSWCQRKFM